MNVRQLNTQLWVPQSLKTVFAFFADATNLETLTPPWLNFKVLSPQPIEMKPGTLIDYQLKLHGIPVRWQSEISAWNPPYAFIDEQVKGPYQLWHHRHLFREHEGGTLVCDQIDYAHLGGNWVHRYFVEPDLKKIFNFRHEKLREIFTISSSEGADSPAEPATQGHALP